MLLLFLTLSFPLFAQEQQIPFSFFKDKPRSLMKDFYIYRYLDQNISAKEARALVGEVKNMNWKLFNRFADKVDDFSFKRIKYCRQLQAEFFTGKDNDCIMIGLSPYKATKLPPETLTKIAEQIAWQYPKRAALYKAIASRDFDFISQIDPKLFLTVFNTTGGNYRKKYLNHPIPPKLLDTLSTLPSFNAAINKIVRTPKLTQLQKSILKFDSSKLNAESNFLLGLNALKQQQEKIALWYFKQSEKKAWNNFEKDKARFWQYLVNRDTKILQTMLTQSKDINLYTLFAYEKLGKLPQNIAISIEPKQPKAPFDITDPFAWLKIKETFDHNRSVPFEVKKRAALKLNSKETEPHVARLIYRYKDNIHYYLFPYMQYIRSLPKKRQALILALARQESRFIPTEISYSYALGLMQFMPFLAKAIAKEEGMKEFRYEQMFDPKIAYRFADIHLDYLEKHLFHPLLVAYAYNGGIGYTRRQIVQNDNCFTKGKYEPFMTMEMLPNAQARKYGKKVLANYVVYARLLGVKDISLFSQLEVLRQKSRISDF